MLHLQLSLAQMRPKMLLQLLLGERLHQLVDLAVKINLLDLANIVFEAHAREVQLCVALKFLLINVVLVVLGLIAIRI